MQGELSEASLDIRSLVLFWRRVGLWGGWWKALKSEVDEVDEERVVKVLYACGEVSWGFWV